MAYMYLLNNENCQHCGQEPCVCAFCSECKQCVHCLGHDPDCGLKDVTLTIGTVQDYIAEME